MNLVFLLTIIGFLFSVVSAQTRTVTNANGQTVVIAVTTIQGVPTTQTLQTLTTQQEQQQGPVGQPPATTGTPFLPTPFQYTTTLNGVRTVIQDTFTPTLGFPSTTIQPQVPSTGIIYDYSSWLAQYSATNAASVVYRPSSGDGSGILSMLAVNLATFDVHTLTQLPLAEALTLGFTGALTTCSDATMSSHPEPPLPQDFIAVVFVIDTSIALGSQWHHVLQSYISPLFRRLVELNPNRNLRIGTVVYTLPDMTTYSPILHKKFFDNFPQIADILRKDAHKIGLGSTLSGYKTGMPALEGVVAAIEMLDALTTSCPSTSPGRPVTLNIFHITAVVPDKTTRPQWNELDTLDYITWETLPSELSTRNIHLSSIVLNSDTSVYTKLHASGSTPTWFQTRPSHTILLSPYFSTALPLASKRPADAPAAEKPPEVKRVRLSSGVAVSSPPVANASPTPSSNSNNTRPSVPVQPPSISGRPPLTPQQLQSLQGLQPALQKLRALEDHIQKLEAGVKDAGQAGDMKKAEEMEAELVKHRTLVVNAKGWIQQQFKQAQLVAQAGQSTPGQKPIAVGGGPANGQSSNGVPTPLQGAQTQGAQTALSRPPPEPKPNPITPGLPPQSSPPPVALPPTLPVPSPAMNPAPIPSPNVNQQTPGFPQNLPNANQMGGAGTPQGLGNSQGSLRMPGVPDLAAQMHKLVEQNERNGRPQPGVGVGSMGGMAGALPGMVPHQNSGQPGMPGQQNPMAAFNGMSVGTAPSPFLKPPGPPAPTQQSQVPVWQGPMVWHPDAMNGMREISAHIAVMANSPNGRLSHSDTWPKTIHLSSSQPINPLDVQAWFKQHQQSMFFGKLMPGPDMHARESYQMLWNTLMTKKIYLLGAWTTPSGGQTNNLLITAAASAGLLGAFFPHEGLPELPKPGQSQPMMGANALLSPEVINRVRAIADDLQRAVTAHGIIMRLQQTVGAAKRTITQADMSLLLNAMNVSVQQLHGAQRMHQQRVLQAQAQGQGQGQQQQQQQPGMPGFGGGGGGSLGMNMGGGGGGGNGGMFNSLLAAQNMMNAQRGNLGGNLGGMNLNLGQQMMNGGGFPGRPGMGGMAGGPGGMQGNVSMEMMQSFAQRNVDGGMGQGHG
ncbi:hypothetical protein L218DRAFT_1073786 [Marasmius fiardii PR-910]|nr:hypothetical protein L218DRAFT_1073786 [Marasmius fiardii PR-910]